MGSVALADPEPATASTLELGTFAALLRVTEKAVRDWIAAGMPVAKQGSRGGGKNRDKTKIDLQAAIGWYFRENYERMELERQRSDLAREQARRVSLENEEKAGLLVRADLIAKDVANMVGAAQALLLAIPSKEAPMLAPLTDANAIEQRLDVSIRDALRELSEYGAVRDRRSADAPPSDGNHGGRVGTAATTNRKRVGRRKPKAQ